MLIAIKKVFSKDRIATVAKTVGRTAEMWDKISIKILKAEAREVANLAANVINNLNLSDKEFDFVFMGSILKIF